MKNLQTTSTNYKLTKDELRHIRELLSFQSLFGPGVKTLAATEYDAYFTSVEQLSYSSVGMANPLFKTWITDFFTPLVAIAGFNEVYMLNKYRRICTSDTNPTHYDERCSKKWISFYHMFLYGWHWETAYYVPGEADIGPDCTYSASPEVWATAMKTLREAWEKKRPEALTTDGPDRLSGKTYHNQVKTILDTKCQTLPASLSVTKVLWTNQLAAAKTMAKATLDASDHLFLLYLLIALPTSEEGKAYAKKILDQKENTDEYENAPFIKLLSYAVLLTLLDPTGEYKWSRDQVKQFLSDTIGIITYSNDQGNEIRNELKAQLDRLNSEKAYPAASRPDMKARQADTLAAISAILKNVPA